MARDRAGEKPLYFAEFNNYLIFGSEIKTIADFPFFKRLNYSSIADYLYLDYISLNKTLFRGIKKVLPGQYIKYHNKNLLTTHIGNLIFNAKNNLSEKKQVLN